tara:strand:- start:75 stop:767 length:693 start_codon:yes stop_codon:yes gene_type:complete
VSFTTPYLPHILVVDDDDRLRALLIKYLEENGFLATGAESASSARIKLKTLEFDLIVLDLMMPGESGLQLAKSLRIKNTVPILMLTAMNEVEDRIRGLEFGADDYIGKPFEPRELLLRINSILRRIPEPPPISERVILGDAIFFPAPGNLIKTGQPMRLTNAEISLLRALATQPGHIFSREGLASITGTQGGGRAVDVQITRLRRKIEADPRLPRYLKTVRGKGYMLVPD